MAATGKTPILLYGSTTASNVPTAGNLTNSSDGCEIAINVADKNLFFKDSTNTVNTVPIRQSSASSDGWLSSTDWSTFNSKQAALVSGTNIKTVGGASLLGSGDVGTIGTGYGGTGLTSFTANGILYASSTSALATSALLTWNGGNLCVDATPPAWLWPSGATGIIQLRANGALSAYNASTYLSQNWYYNAGEKFIDNGYATRYEQSSGNHKWYSSNASNAGGAGAAVTWVTTQTLDASGNLTINGATATKASGTTWANPSDILLKNNVQDFTKGIDELLQVNVKTWEYNGKGGTTLGTKGIGVIANEVENILPETVDTYRAKLNVDDEEEIDIKRFDATEITWLLVNAVKQLKAEIEQLKGN